MSALVIECRFLSPLKFYMLPSITSSFTEAMENGNLLTTSVASVSRIGVHWKSPIRFTTKSNVLSNFLFRQKLILINAIS